MEFPTIDEFAKEVAEKALDEFIYEGKTIREWVEIIIKQQPCEDTISRQAAIDETWKEPSYTDPYNVLTEVRERIQSLPSAQPERKKGKWVEVAVTDGYDKDGIKTWISVMQCDQCGFIVNAVEGHMAQYNYCPNCGADIRGEEV